MDLMAGSHCDQWTLIRQASETVGFRKGPINKGIWQKGSCSRWGTGFRHFKPPILDLVHKSAVNNTIPNVVPITLQPTILFLAHHPVLPGHPRERKMYDTLCWEYYWPHMWNNIYQTLRDCQMRPKESTAWRHQRHLRLFSATGLLKFIAIDIARHFLKSAQGSHIVVVFTDRSSKLSRAKSIVKVTARPCRANFHYPLDYLKCHTGQSAVRQCGPICKQNSSCHFLGVKKLPMAA